MLIKHVIPIKDIEDHSTESDTVGRCYCACGPRWEFQPGMVLYIHNSFDGREGLEWTRIQLGLQQTWGQWGIIEVEPSEL